MMENTRRVTMDDLAEATIDYLPLVPEMVKAVTKARRSKSLPASGREVANFLLNACGFMIFFSHPEEAVQTSMVDMAIATMQLAANGQDALQIETGFKADSLDTLIIPNAHKASASKMKKEQKASSKALDYLLKVLDGPEAGVSSEGEVKILSSQERIAMACATAAGCIVSEAGKEDCLEDIYKTARRFIVQGIFIADPDQMSRATGGLQ